MVDILYYSSHFRGKNKLQSKLKREKINEKRENNNYNNDWFMKRAQTKRHGLKLLSSILCNEYQFGLDYIQCPSYKHDKYIINQIKYEKRQRCVNKYCNIICNINYEFHHKISQLLSLSPDEYLGSKILLKYWKYPKNLCIEGDLTCISHLGFIRIQNCMYFGDSVHGYLHLDLPKGGIENSYWFHYKCIDQILIWNKNEKSYNIDFKYMVNDLMKLKIIKGIELKTKQPIFNINSFNDDINKFVKIFLKSQADKKRSKFHVLLLAKHHKKQIERLQFDGNEIYEIIRQYIKMCRSDNELNVEKRSNVVKENENPKRSNFLDWDSFEIECISSKRIKRTV